MPKTKHDAGTAPTTQPAKYAPRFTTHNLLVREARASLPEVVRTAGSSSVVYTVGRRGDGTATIISTQRIAPLFDTRKEPKLALVLVEQFLADAPLHLKTAAVAELSQLSTRDLLVLLAIDSLPLEDDEAEKIRAHLESKTALDRLLRRFELAGTIARAESEGLYEATAHKSSDAV